MALKNWWEVTTPHKDIQSGKFNEAIFAADLWDAVFGNAPKEYKDPALFFQKTYMTQGLHNLLDNVFNRLTGKRGDPVIQLQTQFGGGKTHGLLALYHSVAQAEKIKHIEGFQRLPNVKAKVAVFVGTQADALKGKTPWGEIADQLGCYNIVADHDKKRVAPGKENISKIFKEAGPTLILMDEILEYIVKANEAETGKRTHGQTLAFLQELTEAVTATENCCLVMTLPASILERYSEAAEAALQQLQKVSGRLEAIYTPVDGMERYEVVRKRLFEDFGDESTRKIVAQAYFEMYQKLGIDVPANVKELDYRDALERAYPFHPELIDVLYERWGSYSTFQRTRGVLRLLAQVVADAYKKRSISPLINSSLVNLANQTIRREFIKHIGNEYEAVIAADVADHNAKSQFIDKQMGSEYEKYQIAQGIATAVFLYSFSAGQSKDTTLPRIRVAVLREGIPSTIVGDAVTKLAEELWYFHSDGNKYSFRNQPNLNRVIIERQETLSQDLLDGELKELLQKYSEREFELYLWPENPADIPDSKNFKLAIFSPKYVYDSSKGKSLVKEMFERAGTTFRVYKNTLFVLATSNEVAIKLYAFVRRMLALRNIIEDKELLQSLTSESMDELKRRLKDAEKNVGFEIDQAYRYLAIVETSGIAWKDLGIPTIGTSTSISKRVRQFLIDQERLLEKIGPQFILDKSFRKEEDKKSVQEIYELMLRNPGMPVPLNEGVLLSGIKDGIQSGLLGGKIGDTVFYKEDIIPSSDLLILRGPAARLEKEKITSGENVPAAEGLIEKVVQQEKPSRGVTKLFLRASLSWDKVSHIIRGVITPLQQKGSSPEITIEIKAESQEGFDRTTLDSHVKETLQQIGAKIEKWEEE